MPRKPIQNPYTTLGVPKDADQDAIKDAYREQAKATHPDVPGGGDPEKFTALAIAYSILGDEKKRAEWDSTGQVADENAIDLKAMATLIKSFLGMLNQIANDSGMTMGEPFAYIATEAHAVARKELGRASAAREKAKKDTAAVRRVMARMKRKKQDVPPLIENALSDAINNIEKEMLNAVAKYEHEAAVMERVAFLAEGYELEPEAFDAQAIAEAGVNDRRRSVFRDARSYNTWGML